MQPTKHKVKSISVSIKDGVATLTVGDVEDVGNKQLSFQSNDKQYQVCDTMTITHDGVSWTDSDGNDVTDQYAKNDGVIEDAFGAPIIEEIKNS